MACMEYENRGMYAEVLLAVQCAVQCSVCAGSNSVLVIDLHVCIRFIIIGR